MDVMRAAFYRHKKSGGLYTVIALARVEATLERVVVYQAVTDEWEMVEGPDHVWTRPLAEFADGRFERV